MADTKIINCSIYKPPNKPASNHPSVFFAGSIEMGKASNWQEELTSAIEDLPIAIFNPRRDDWDSKWIQDILNPKFREQVEWEMLFLEVADMIVLFLEPSTISPISLLELGLHARGGKLLVCCPNGFHRRGNVQVLCEAHNIPMVESFKELKLRVREEVETIIRKKTSGYGQGFMSIFSFMSPSLWSALLIVNGLVFGSLTLYDLKDFLR